MRIGNTRKLQRGYYDFHKTVTAGYYAFFSSVFNYKVSSKLMTQ